MYVGNEVFSFDTNIILNSVLSHTNSHKLLEIIIKSDNNENFTITSTVNSEAKNIISTLEELIDKYVNVRGEVKLEDLAETTEEKKHLSLLKHIIDDRGIDEIIDIKAKMRRYVNVWKANTILIDYGMDDKVIRNKVLDILTNVLFDVKDKRHIALFLGFIKEYQEGIFVTYDKFRGTKIPLREVITNIEKAVKRKLKIMDAKSCVHKLQK